MNDWNRIKAHYDKHKLAIHRAGKNGWGLDPYAWEFDADIVLTPIERGMWHDIRCANLVMYPQYPVDRYFVDFANPVAKVAIECDGASFHTDTAKDELRQRIIEAYGWTVYRAPGWACVKDDQMVEDECGMDKVDPGELTLLMRQINQRHDIPARGINRTFDPLELILRGVA